MVAYFVFVTVLLIVMDLTCTGVNTSFQELTGFETCVCGEDNCNGAPSAVHFVSIPVLLSMLLFAVSF